MEIKEAAERRVVIAKPVACRPTCNSTFGSFSELLAGAINAPSSSTSNLSQTSSIAAAAAAIIKPKTLRIFNPPPHSQSHAEAPTIIYRPQAKLVSKRTASLLANMGGFNQIQQETTLTHHNPNREAEAEAEAEEEEELSPTSNNAVEAEVQQATEQLTISSTVLQSQQLEEVDINPKALAASVHVAYGDRPSYDGYNWRKYGQKQVKGSEYPRSYYKCTHPSCPVKKKVERSLDGQIAEIVYKGEHNHSKPSLPARRNSLGGGGGGHCGSSTNDKGNACGIVGGEIRIESGLVLPNSNVAGTGSDGCCGRPAEGIEVQGDQDEPRSKKRRAEDERNDEAGNAGEAGGRETGAEAEVLGDGFRWRKYGQKVVRGNPYPRSYYRCANIKCKVRKYVERSPDDPNALVTTYEGKHNHDIPAAP